MSFLDLNSTALAIRRKLVTISHRNRIPHLGSALSCTDILVAAYNGVLEIDSKPSSIDHFILSKGHAANALYAVLAEKGFFAETLLETIGQPDGVLSEHPVLGSAPGIETTSGSLGHGLPIGVGMCLADRIQHSTARTFVLMSDGECNEGSVWEAAMLAPAHNLERLVVIIDANKWQATGRSEEITALQPLADKWRAFGWSVFQGNGHDIPFLVTTLKNVPDGTGKPVVVIADTVKGKGVSFMEDDNNWHYRIPDDDEYERAMSELVASPDSQRASEKREIFNKR